MSHISNSKEDIEFQIVDSEELTPENIDVISHCLARLIWRHIQNEEQDISSCNKNETRFEGKGFQNDTKGTP